MERGRYIIIDGGEGCGKSTQIRLLKEFLDEREIRCVFGREPGGVPEAEAIRSVCLNKQYDLAPITELFLFEAARTEFFRRVVVPSLNAGQWVISDRSGFSTEAYQGYASGLDLGLIRQFNNLATCGVRPDISFIIDVPVEIGLDKEVAPDRFATKGIEYHTRVNAGYREIARANPDICVLLPYISGGIDRTQEQIRNVVRKRLLGFS
ncbi:MAG: dTMP kinase [Nanoarchaeota archaeon]